MPGRVRATVSKMNPTVLISRQKLGSARTTVLNSRQKPPNPRAERANPRRKRHPTRN